MAGSTVSVPNVDALRNRSREKLAYLLSMIPGDKDLILDPDLILPLDRLAGASFLKKCGIGKIHKLDPQVAVEPKQRVYILRPTLEKTKVICDHINSHKSQNKRLARVDVVFLPRKLYVCEELFEYEGVYGDVNLISLDLGFIPLDRDILSLELPNYYSDFFVNKNYIWIQTVANSLVELQKEFGFIPNVYGQGLGAKLVYDMMQRMLTSANVKHGLRDREIGHLFLIDRDVDHASTLLTQLTYEGQLDEIFSIKCGYIALGSEVTGKSDPVKLSLTSEDKLFDEIRDSHITKAFDILSKKVKELVQSAEKRQNMNVSDMRAYIKTDLTRHQQHHGSVALRKKTFD
uniref:Uncharacterized protein n=1 Tax=Strigamia maritima TaxID=126957 RepID=T1IZA9_STRMM